MSASIVFGSIWQPVFVIILSRGDMKEVSNSIPTKEGHVTTISPNILVTLGSGYILAGKGCNNMHQDYIIVLLYKSVSCILMISMGCLEPTKFYVAF